MKTHYLLLILLLFLIQSTVSAQVDEAIKNKQRVSYVYNFTKYIDWENLDNQEEFVIGILGKDNDALVQEFKTAAQQKTIKDLPVVVKTFRTRAEITPTNILYLNKKDGFDLTPLLEQLYFDHCLLVTEGYPFRMSMINFIELDDEFHFEISQEKINRAALLVDPELLSFSIQSTADWNLLYDRLLEEKKTVSNQDEELKKLAKEIESQKKEIANQENKLAATLAEIEIQKLLLDDQQSIISDQKKDITNQLNRLLALRQEISENEQANQELLKTFELQYLNIVKQEKQLDDQYETLEIQKQDIAAQEQKILEQNDTLKIQVGEIEQQRLTLYIFLAFLIFAVIFIFYMYRANKRRKESEHKLHLRNLELIELNKSLDSFTYRVSHDLKAPIINVKNMISMLEEFIDKSSNPLFPEIFTNLDSSTNRLESTILDMLKLTRIERIEEAKSFISINEVLVGLLPNYKNELAQINGELINNISAEARIYASDIELKSIFQNLITNSIKYRQPEHPLKIELSTQMNDSTCTITYTDNGMGIDLKKFEAKLFSMFERFNTDSTIEGTGVGMYIIKKLVDNNRGSLALTSTVNNGLTYKITLPTKLK